VSQLIRLGTLLCVGLFCCAVMGCAEQVINEVDEPPVGGVYAPPNAGFQSSGGVGAPPPSAGAQAPVGGMSAGSTVGGMTSGPAPFTPPPGARRCEFREQCNEGQYCYMEYCVDQQPCGEFAVNPNCPEGYACVGDLCFEDGGEGSCLSVSPSNINFGEVARGDVATQEITLSACGSAPVSVTQVALSAGSPNTFAVEPGGFPVSLSPGQSSTVTVSYSPSMVGMDSGSVDVSSTDFSNPSQRVTLSASATPPALEDTGLHVRLEWSTNSTDVDLHLLGPSNGGIWDCTLDCNFANPNPSWGDPLSDLDNPYLDLDDVDGYGPENINIQDPAPGVYTVVVHYWTDHGGDVPLATVHALSYGEVVATIGPQALNIVGDVWYAFEIEFPGNVVRPLGSLGSSPPSVPSCK